MLINSIIEYQIKDNRAKRYLALQELLKSKDKKTILAKLNREKNKKSENDRFYIKYTNDIAWLKKFTGGHYQFGGLLTVVCFNELDRIDTLQKYQNIKGNAKKITTNPNFSDIIEDIINYIGEIRPKYLVICSDNTIEPKYQLNPTHFQHLLKTKLSSKTQYKYYKKIDTEIVREIPTGVYKYGSNKSLRIQKIFKRKTRCYVTDKEDLENIETKVDNNLVPNDSIRISHYYHNTYNNSEPNGIIHNFFYNGVININITISNNLESNTTNEYQINCITGYELNPVNNMIASKNNGELYGDYKNRTYKFKIGSKLLNQPIDNDQKYHRIFSGSEKAEMRYPYYNRVSILNIK